MCRLSLVDYGCCLNLYMAKYHKKRRSKQAKNKTKGAIFTNTYLALSWLPVNILQTLIRFQLFSILILISVCLHYRNQCLDSYCETGERPLLLVVPGEGYTEYFDDIRRVFHRLGYQRKHKSDTQSDWDVLWLHEYPYHALEHRRRKFNMAQSPLPYQKVNHIPSTFMMTAKANLLREGGKFIPVGFLMPQDKTEFLQEIQKTSNKTRLWIQKCGTQGGCKVKDTQDLDLDSSSIIQEFIQNPFLIDGYKFNIGVFVLLTSIEPLRAYILESATTDRFCLKTYSAGNYTDTATYVTDFDYPRRISEVPSLKKLFKNWAYSRLKAVEAHLQLMGKDSTVVRKQIYAAVRDVLTSREARMRQGIPAGLVDLKNSNFELMRWDFLLDENLKLHLIEANMSPDLHAHLSDVPKTQLVEHVIFNCFKVAGLTDIRKHGAVSSSLNSIRDSDINVGIAICVQSKCDTCESKDCFVCSHCMTEEEREVIRLVLVEHINRQNMRRVYPEEMANMSPDLHAHPSDVPKTQLVEHVIFNCFKVAGLTDIRKHGAVSSSLNSIRDSDINVGIAICVQSKCDTCESKDCFVCSHCMTGEEREVIRLVLVEHINRQNMRRVYPEEMTLSEAMDYDVTDDEHLSDNDQLTRAWLKAKCTGDPCWCH